MDLTLRSKIVVRWTTCPADMGYGGTPSAWLTHPGEIMGLRRAREFAYALQQKIGHGTYYRISYQFHGKEISIADIKTALDNLEYAPDY